MAQKSGTAKSASRQGSGGSETRTVTVEIQPPPPPPASPTMDFQCSDTYYRDFLAVLGKAVVVTYDDTTSPPTVTGLSATA